jgi:hypothetical protein
VRSRLAKAARAAVAGPQLFRLLEGPPTDLGLFALAIFATRTARGRGWPRGGGSAEWTCPNRRCPIATVRLEVAPAPPTWERTPPLLCPACGFGLTFRRRLETLTLLPTTAGGEEPC